MALIDITPTMTSNNTPAPYVISSSTFFTGQEPYKAFDGVDGIANNAWVTSGGNTTGWIKLDLSMEMKCNAFSITSRSTGGISGTPPVHVGTTEAPRSFKLYGSDDDLSYDLILSLENEVLWTPQETRLYNLPFGVTYRYYKIIISANNGYNSYLGIGEIKFYQDDGTTPVIENRNNSLRYTLPYGSKLKLDNLTSDLTYMLATESDDNNEGTLRLVNSHGKFIIPKARQKIDLIFDGNANTTGNFSLSKSINEYTSIRIIADMYSTSTNRNSISQDRTVTEILSKVGNDIVFSSTPASSIYRYITINFTNDTSFNVTEILKANGNPCIEKIYGIY